MASSSQKGDHPENEGHRQSSGGRKAPHPPASRPHLEQAAAAAGAAAALKCPRCDSPNTKFCYYNNYSLSQPRHFCKTCRRYWTRGGALRSVPIGGGCRKNKKVVKPSLSRLSGGNSSSTAAFPSSVDMGRFKFLNSHLSTPAMDFQIGALSFAPVPALNLSPATGGGVFNYHFSASSSSPMINQSSASMIPACFNLDPPPPGITSSLLGFNFSFPCNVLKRDGENKTSAGGAGFQEMGANVNLASSIESLSSINQELHWKLQQQRFAMFYGGEKEKPQPMLFQNLENILRAPPPETAAEGGGGNLLETEWLLDTTASFEKFINPSGNSNENGNVNENENPTSNWNNNGFQAWSSSSTMNGHHTYNMP
ncbi:unnamed protein product [Cuscuta europaea]|uniref:Dof zinc finger protein n=1 Tax=Cuscuta europaea TaxID=41803 RepID=A0A9P0ZPR0_CUSEU|nr:unnamed protein product [Cuscuta europaea]